MASHRKWTTILLLISTCLGEQAMGINPLDWRPCGELSRELRPPCRCKLEPPSRGSDPAVHMNCDRVVFVGDFPALPYRAPIISFSQRWAGHQNLPTQSFTTSALPIQKLDFSGNNLGRLSDRVFHGLQDTLVELRLADNLLGSSLNPIFSTSEFHGLANLQILDLSGNYIKGLEEGILKGCGNLQELYLNRNSFTEVPGTSLNGPKALKVLSLTNNRIDTLHTSAFHSQPSIEKIDLSHNLVSSIEGGSFESLNHLKWLILTHNRFSKFNSDVFQGANKLEIIDLSQNFITEFPTIALKSFESLKTLNMSSNLIQSIDNNNLATLTNLRSLDLSRNNIANIAPGTFLGLKQLKHLDISVNSLRTIEDDAFEGLDNLQSIVLQDNNILLIPASALGRLPQLTSLQLEYNRIAALSGDILRSIADKVTSLDLSRNVIRELPAATFQHFKYLKRIDLTRNLLSTVSSETFSGLESSLLVLEMSQNRIAGFTGPPLNLPKLKHFDLSDNQLTDLQRNTFAFLPMLMYLNLSRNAHMRAVPSNIIHPLSKLKVLDLSFTGLKNLSPELLSKSSSIEYVYLNDNGITEIPEGAFINLRNLTLVDLSRNRITNIKPSAFVNVMNIQQLLLRGNQLSAFKGEFFNTGTSLEILDLSDNQLSYLFPSSFRIHPRLRQIMAARNKFNFFPAELIASLQFLELVDLSSNGLKSVEELDFARLPRLRTLLLSNNQLESISEMAFHNSTQLQILDLGHNKLERLGERTFEGLARLELLNLENNLLSELPEGIFERSRLHMLENINLAHNLFEVAPLKSLQRQYFFVSSVDLSHNQLKEVPADNNIMVNIKRLDLSFNPLTSESIKNVLSEPKTVRELNLAATGITELTQLETPFLYRLNLSYNNITKIPEKVFERTTLLEILDLSENQLDSVNPKVWPMLRNIQTLNISNNPISSIAQGDLDGLETVKTLSIHSLKECARIEKNAFKNLLSLNQLEAYNYPKLGYLDAQGILSNLPYLESLDIELKDPAVGSDQLSTILHSRLKELGIRGPRLHSISSGTLSGLKAPSVSISLRNTSLTSLPAALFFPMPRSSKVILDVSGSQLTSLSPQMLIALEDRRGDLKVVGLETNPVVCDCGARALRRWLPAHMTTIRCSAPDYLVGKLLVEIGDDELTCDPRTSTTTTAATVAYTKSTRMVHRVTTEPEIIWSVAPKEKTTKKPIIKAGAPIVGAITNDDTLIIGIVGGVVAFIAILIIIICIVRLRMTSTHYSGGPLANGAPMATMGGPGSSCACSVKSPMPQIYGVPPPYASTLPHKVHSASLRTPYATMGRVPYYQNVSQPYFVAISSDEKVYR